MPVIKSSFVNLSNFICYLEGVKIAIVSIVILFLLSYAGLGNKPNLSLLIYYLIIFISCIFGSIVGINKSKKENEQKNKN